MLNRSCNLECTPSIIFLQHQFIQKKATQTAMSRILFVLLSACLLYHCAPTCEDILGKMTKKNKAKIWNEYNKCKQGEHSNLKRSGMNNMNENNNIQSDRLPSRPFSRKDGSFMTPVATLWWLHASSGDAAASRTRFFKR